LCQFFSGLAFKNGDIHYNSMTDSHEDLISEKELDDDADLSSIKRNWIRFEYTSNTLQDIKTYKLRIDEEFTPPWCDKKYQKNLAQKKQANGKKSNHKKHIARKTVKKQRRIITKL